VSHFEIRIREKDVSQWLDRHHRFAVSHPNFRIHDEDVSHFLVRVRWFGVSQAFDRHHKFDVSQEKFKNLYKGVNI